MRRILTLKRDYYAGALLVLIGLVLGNEGRNDVIGTLRQMGPGYIPVVLGTILVCLGALIAVTATAGDAHNEDAAAMPHSEWRGWFCIVAGPVCFMVLGKYLGMAPATFACVFISALGDRQATLRGTTLLSVAVTAFGVLLFSYVLKIPMPIFQMGAP